MRRNVAPYSSSAIRWLLEIVQNVSSIQFQAFLNKGKLLEAKNDESGGNDE
jgi:hypothetical protein